MSSFLPFPNPYPITPMLPTYSSRGDKQRPLEIGPVAPYSWALPFKDGLPTPPNDMAIAYNTLPPAVGYGKSTGTFNLSADIPSGQIPRASSSLVYPSISISSYSSQPASSGSARSTSSSTSTNSNSGTTNNDNNLSFLEIPSSITNGKGNLAKFAAQIACLFWFEKTAKLKAIEDGLKPYPFILPEAIPSPGFQKWATTILSTTQVSQSVILLALLFIYRMKKFNPGVKGKKGSECRLLTIALMLGNKCKSFCVPHQHRPSPRATAASP